MLTLLLQARPMLFPKFLTPTTNGIPRNTVKLQPLIDPPFKTRVTVVPRPPETLQRLLHRISTAPPCRLAELRQPSSLLIDLLRQCVARIQRLIASLLAPYDPTEAPPPLTTQGQRPEIATSPVQNGRGSRLRQHVDLPKNSPLPILQFTLLLPIPGRQLPSKKHRQLKSPQVPLWP